MSKTKVALERFSMVRVDGAPDESELRKALLALDLDERQLEKVYEILYQTKVKWVLGVLPGKQIEYAELWENTRIAAIEALGTLRRFFGPTIWDLDRQKYAAEIAIHEKQIQRTKVKIPDFIFKNRRKVRRLSQPWISAARKELLSLGLRKTSVNELLRLTGLSKPRPNKR
jgi:hypothetical protein